MKSIEHQFLDFCRSKPADEKYSFVTTEPGECGCAITQFLDGLGQPVGCRLWHDMHDMVTPSGQTIGLLAAHWPTTFGSLVSRLESSLNTRENEHA